MENTKKFGYFIPYEGLNPFFKLYLYQAIMRGFTKATTNTID